ncbi:MAG: AmpG family muropeptide MFS transporter [Myxococcota bacterium]
MAQPLWRAIFNYRMLLCVLTGFASGMPLFVYLNLIPAWLHDADVDITTITLFSLVGLPWTWKFLWAPLLDRYAIPGFGRRRGWTLVSQVGILCSMLIFCALNPVNTVLGIAGVLALVAVFSATQDIALDAYRRELLPDEELGLGNAFFVNAYRLSALVPGSLALILADFLPWGFVHLIVASFMAIGVVTTLLMPEPKVEGGPPRTLAESVIKPFQAFFASRGAKTALLVLGFVLAYKIGDSMATAVSTVFYLDLGFSKTIIGSVGKGAQLWASVVGAFIGGIVMIKLGISRSLWIFGAVQLLSILGFAVLALVGPVWWLLFGVVSFEYLGVGMGTAALVSYIASSTDMRYTATQFALLTSLSSVPRTFANAATGWLVDTVDYPFFFAICAAFALPGMAMLLWVSPWTPKPQPEESAA